LHIVGKSERDLTFPNMHKTLPTLKEYTKCLSSSLQGIFINIMCLPSTQGHFTKCFIHRGGNGLCLKTFLRFEIRQVGVKVHKILMGFLKKPFFYIRICEFFKNHSKSKRSQNVEYKYFNQRCTRMNILVLYVGCIMHQTK
jgi:hypothetical protein